MVWQGGHQGWSSFWGECCIIILASREDFILRCGVDNRLFGSHRTYSRRTKEVHPLVSRITILPKLELDSMSSPIPQCQTTDTVVAEWQTSCETHRHTILFQILRSVLTLRQHKQAQPTGKRLEKSTLAASTLAYCVFVLQTQTTRNKRPIRQFTMDKPQANLVQIESMGRSMASGATGFK